MQKKEYQNTLRSCPFCGGEAKVSDVFGRAGVICKDCLAEMRGYLGMTEEEVIKAWNTRKPIDKVVEALEDEYDNAGRLTGYFYNHNTYETHGYMEGLKKAIEIVKGGADNV